MKKFIIILLILFSILLCLLMCLLMASNENNTNTGVTTEIVAEPKTIEDVIKKHDSEYISETDNKIYVKFGKDLFNEKGESNKNYFYDLIEELKPFFKATSFYIIDEEKDINIYVEYDLKIEDYIIKINNIENFFDNINGKSYVDVETSKIKNNSPIIVDEFYLNKLQMNSMYFSSISEELGEGTDLGNGYTSYKNGTIRLRVVPTKAVRNIIFSEDYEGDITTKIKSGMSLKEIYKINSENAFGSLNENYLGYKDGNYYIFFYSDETSIYTYSYSYNKDFEKLLKDYLQSKDLDTFVTRLVSKVKAYDYYEYDKENQNAYILYSNRGIEINIKNNDSKGIKLYTNYYFTDETKKYVKDGLISFDSENDLLENVEKSRRNGKSITEFNKQ